MFLRPASNTTWTNLASAIRRTSAFNDAEQIACVIHSRMPEREAVLFVEEFFALCQYTTLDNGALNREIASGLLSLCSAEQFRRAPSFTTAPLPRCFRSRAPRAVIASLDPGV